MLQEFLFETKAGERLLAYLENLTIWRLSKPIGWVNKKARSAS